MIDMEDLNKKAFSTEKGLREKKKKNRTEACGSAIFPICLVLSYGIGAIVLRGVLLFNTYILNITY